MHRAVCLVAASVVQLGLAMSTNAQTKISGTIQCAKPDSQQSIDVGDRPNHALGISKSAGTWSRPLEIGGSQTKQGYSVASADVSNGRAHAEGYHVSTMADGGKIYVRFRGTDKMTQRAPPSSSGTWAFTGGTGKLKGLKGEGTCKGTGAADGSMTFEVEGEYVLPKAP